MVTAIAYYLDRHLGILTGGVVADKHPTLQTMEGDEASTPVRSIRPAKTAVPLESPPESPPGDVPGVALREEKVLAIHEKAQLDGSTIVPPKDTANNMAATLGKGPLRPADRADSVGPSGTLPHERAGGDRDDVSGAPDVSTLPIEPGQNAAQASLKRGGAKNTDGYKARGPRRSLEDKGIPTPPISERRRPQKVCEQQERILGLCD
jgi:hypothetical protein